METTNRVGTTVGHIRITRFIGAGGMGEVYEGFDETLRRSVAVKTIGKDARLSSTSKARFLREARALSQLDHPHICKIYDYVEGEDSDFLVLERIEGRNLWNAIQTGLDQNLKLRIAEQVADVLVVAHEKGVVHRDIKSTNVMLTRDGLALPLLRVEGQPRSELTGPAFDPKGKRLYFSSQRGSDGRGITYEVRGPDHAGADHTVKISFAARGEDRSFPTALASCTAKYVRELVMVMVSPLIPASEPISMRASVSRHLKPSMPRNSHCCCRFWLESNVISLGKSSENARPSAISIFMVSTKSKLTTL